MSDQSSASLDGGTPDAAWRALTNSAYAMVEFGWPIVIALLVTPVIVNGLGPSAFGVLSILAVTLGIFGLFDLGLGGAALRAVAQAAERGDVESAARVLGTVVTAYVGIGLIGAALIVVVTPVMVSRVLTIPAELQSAAMIAFDVSAVGLPVSLVAGAFASVPKAVQRFDLSTRVAVVFSTIGPLVTAGLVMSGQGLPQIVTASLIVNVMMGLVYYRVACHLLGVKHLRVGLDRALLHELGRFGGWFITASFGVTILYQFDKILLGTMLSVAAVTYYVVPGALANRIQGAVGAATQIVFPASAAIFVQHERHALVRLYRDGTRLSFLLAATLSVPLAIFAEPFLRYWLGPEFAAHSTVVMVLLVGTYVLLGLTGVAWGIGFGSGRAKVNAVFALAMGAIDVGLMLALVGRYQIVGAAFAFLASAALGVPALIIYVERSVVGLSGWEFLAQYGRVLPAVVLQMLGALALRTMAANLVATVLLMGVSAMALPLLYLALGLAAPEDRALLAKFLGRVRQLPPSGPR